MKPIKWITLGLALLAILSVAAVYILRTHDAAFTDEGLLQANADDLPHTIVTPHLETPIEVDENVLWCGTFQLAWNEACDLIGEDPQFENEPAMVGVLNKKSFTKRGIDAESYVAVAGYLKDDIHGQIQRQLEQTFSGQAAPRFIPPKEPNPGPNDFIAYAYLFKNLEFPIPFELIEEPIVFGTEAVTCFGIGKEHKPEHSQMLEQFIISDYKSEDDFVLRFITKDTRDWVILAKTPPEPTLEATIKAVQQRAMNDKPHGPGEVLKIPKLNFDITREYDELKGKTFIATDPSLTTNLVVTRALQNVRFQFDEHGVRLRSEAHLEGKSVVSKSETPHIMIFDKPFLIMLQRRDADVPYFALWVGNAELLVKSQ